MTRRVLLALVVAGIFLVMTSLVVFALPPIPITCTGSNGIFTCTIANGATAECLDSGLLNPQPSGAPAPIGALACTGKTGFQGGTRCLVGYADLPPEGFTLGQDPFVFLRCTNAQGKPVGPAPARHE